MTSDHLLQNFRHIVLDGTDSRMVTAVVTGPAIADLLFRNADLFHLIARFRGALCKLIAQNVRIAALAGAAR